MATAAHPTRDDFAALLNESLGGEDQGFEGRVVKGTVTAIENDHAVIDVGLKSEGRVPLREFAAPGQKAELAVGDTVEVYVDRVENVNGEAMLSRDRAIDHHAAAVADGQRGRCGQLHGGRDRHLATQLPMAQGRHRDQRSHRRHLHPRHRGFR